MKALEEGKKVRCVDWTSLGVEKKIFPLFIDLSTNFSISSTDIESEWELYEETENLLSWAEVVKGLKKGKKFIRKHWPKGSLPIEATFRSSVGHLREYLNLEDFEAADWIEAP
jgi:hypothetical protein